MCDLITPGRLTHAERIGQFLLEAGTWQTEASYPLPESHNARYGLVHFRTHGLVFFNH